MRVAVMDNLVSMILLTGAAAASLPWQWDGDNYATPVDRRQWTPHDTDKSNIKSMLIKLWGDGGPASSHFPSLPQTTKPEAHNSVITTETYPNMQKSRNGFFNKDIVLNTPDMSWVPDELLYREGNRRYKESQDQIEPNIYEQMSGQPDSNYDDASYYYEYPMSSWEESYEEISNRPKHYQNMKNQMELENKFQNYHEPKYPSQILSEKAEKPNSHHFNGHDNIYVNNKFQENKQPFHYDSGEREFSPFDGDFISNIKDDYFSGPDMNTNIKDYKDISSQENFDDEKLAEHHFSLTPKEKINEKNGNSEYDKQEEDLLNFSKELSKDDKDEQDFIVKQDRDDWIPYTVSKEENKDIDDIWNSESFEDWNSFDTKLENHNADHNTNHDNIWMEEEDTPWMPPSSSGINGGLNIPSSQDLVTMLGKHWQPSEESQREACHARNLHYCGTQVIDEFTLEPNYAEKCHIREEFLDCMVRQRRASCDGSHGELFTRDGTKLIRDKVRQLLWAARGCILGY